MHDSRDIGNVGNDVRDYLIIIIIYYYFIVY